MVGEHQPGHGLGQGWQVGEGQALLGLGLVQSIAQQPPVCMVQPQRLKGLRISARCCAACQPLQPACVVVLPHKRLEQSHRYPFMAVVVALVQSWVLELVLECLRGFAQVVQQGRQGGQGGDVRQVVPGVFIVCAANCFCHLCAPRCCLSSRPLCRPGRCKARQIWGNYVSNTAKYSCNAARCVRVALTGAVVSS